VNWLKQPGARCPPPHHVLDLLKQRVDLRGRHVSVLLVDQRGVQRQLPQQRQRAQDREPSCG